MKRLFIFCNDMIRRLIFYCCKKNKNIIWTKDCKNENEAIEKRDQAMFAGYFDFAVKFLLNWMKNENIRKNKAIVT